MRFTNYNGANIDMDTDMDTTITTTLPRSVRRGFEVVKQRLQREPRCNTKCGPLAGVWSIRQGASAFPEELFATPTDAIRSILIQKLQDVFDFAGFSVLVDPSRLYQPIPADGGWVTRRVGAGRRTQTTTPYVH